MCITYARGLGCIVPACSWHFLLTRIWHTYNCDDTMSMVMIHWMLLLWQIFFWECPKGKECELVGAGFRNINMFIVCKQWEACRKRSSTYWHNTSFCSKYFMTTNVGEEIFPRNDNMFYLSLLTQWQILTSFFLPSKYHLIKKINMMIWDLETCTLEHGALMSIIIDLRLQPIFLFSSSNSFIMFNSLCVSLHTTLFLPPVKEVAGG